MENLRFLPRTNENQKWGCGCIVLNEEGKMLMGLRCKVTDKRQWSFVGGKVEIGETPSEAITREALEEAGINLTYIKYLGCFELDGVIDYIFASAQWEGVPTPAPREFAELRWATIDDTKSLDMFPYSEKALDMLLDWTS